MSKTTIAVIGAGYWGPNLIRNYNQIPGCSMKMCVDKDETKLKRIKDLYSDIQVTADLNDLLNDKEITAVSIATPVFTHTKLALACLNAGKHVMIEKPMAASSEECQMLIETAQKNNRVLMVGHTFEFTAPVHKAKEIIDSGELGEIQYINCARQNLGLFQQDINVIWDLAPHDISIILYLLGKYPVSVNAQGKAHYKPGIEDVATTTLNFQNGAIAFIQNSWLDPAKTRKITIVGSKKMMVYDDINTNEKIKIYDKGVDTPPYYDTFAEFHYSYRYGDIYIPHIKEHEPLRRECEHFLECIETGKRPVTDGYNGLRVVSILEAANRSIKENGAAQPVDMNQLVVHRQIKMAV